MDLKTLYDIIFPIGGVDDNNRYTQLNGNEINCVQLVEPSLGVSEFVLPKKYKSDPNNVPDKYAYSIPLISIDDNQINQLDICEFSLDYTDFIPTLKFEFVDTFNSILSTNVPKAGSIIKVYIGGHGDELYYKPIRQDFVLTSIRKIGGGSQNDGDIFKYRVYGELNVPYGYRREAWAAGKSTAMQALFNIAVWTGLGFSTNFTKSNTPDTMNWMTTEDSTYFDFMEDITAHACYSPNTFFTSFIDQYNVLNFVECHSLLSHGGQKTDVPAMIYRAYPPEKLPPYDPSQEKTTRNQLPLRDDDDELNNAYQKLSYYFISNNDKYNGWTNFIEEYYEISNGGSSLDDGYRAHLKYTDSNVDNWGFYNCDFSIRPIDNLKRNPETQNIESIDEEPSQDSYIPLNLTHTASEEYLGDLSSVDNMTSVESFTNFGEVDTTNVFKQYYFAEVQNSYQLRCLKRCGLQVKLQNYNPAITKYSRIWVDIYDKNTFSQIVKRPIRKPGDNGEYLKYKEELNNDILQFDNEAEKDIDGVFNRALSGWYVVTGIEINYDPDESNLYMDLTLNRIEYQPIFKSDYTLAKKAIDKYKEENKIEDILTPSSYLSQTTNTDSETES